MSVFDTPFRAVVGCFIPFLTLVLSSSCLAEMQPCTYPPQHPGYINAEGRCVPRPTLKDIPGDAPTAKCRDGTESHSKNRSGTCSRHGGVAQWYTTR